MTTEANTQEQELPKAYAQTKPAPDLADYQGLLDRALVLGLPKHWLVENLFKSHNVRETWIDGRLTYISNYTWDAHRTAGEALYYLEEDARAGKAAGKKGKGGREKGKGGREKGAKQQAQQRQIEVPLEVNDSSEDVGVDIAQITAELFGSSEAMNDDERCVPVPCELSQAQVEDLAIQAYQAVNQCPEAEAHDPEFPCFSCGYRPEESPPLPAVIQSGHTLIDSETGEVLNPEECFEIAGVAPEQSNEFAITDDQSASWFLGLIRKLQHRIEDTLSQAAAMVRQDVRAIEGLQFFYGGQLREWAIPQLPVYSRGEKAGQYRVKNVKTLAGTVFFKKNGGVKAFDHQAVKNFINELPEKDFEEFGVRWERKFSYATLTKLVERGYQIPGYEVVPEVALGDMSIGGTKRWSFNKLKTETTGALKSLTVRGQDDDAGEEGNE